METTICMGGVAVQPAGSPGISIKLISIIIIVAPQFPNQSRWCWEHLRSEWMDGEKET